MRANLLNQNLCSKIMEKGEMIEAGHNRGRKLDGNVLVPIFGAIIVLGCVLHLSTYQTFRLAFAHRFKQSSLQTWQWTNNFIIPNATIVDPHSPTLLDLNFGWVRNTKYICKPSDLNTTKLLAILVHTSRSHFKERLVIRKTWGSIKVYKKWSIRLVFLMGEANFDTNLQQLKHQGQKLMEEQAEFQDLVVGNFTDSYKNLTYKHIMGYKWILNYCQNAHLVIKTDDDMFIDVMRFLNWRSLDFKKSREDLEKVPDLYCYNYDGTIPVRNKSHKWYASEQQWPYEYYPDYCSGWAYAITVDLIQKLYSVSNHIKYFWVDDVFATGALLEVVKKKYDYYPEKRNISGEVTRNIKGYKMFCRSKNWDKKRTFGAVVHVARDGQFERDMMCMWTKTIYDFMQTNSERKLKLRIGTIR